MSSESQDKSPLSEFMDKMTQLDQGALAFTLQSKGSSWVLGFSSNINPMAFSEPLKSFLIDTNRNHLNNPNDDLQVPDYALNSLVHAVLGYLDEMKFLDKQLKYQKFSEGDLNGLSSEEVDEFLDIKLREIKRKKDNLIPLIYRSTSKNSILYSPNYDLILSLAHDLRLEMFKVNKVKLKPKKFSELSEVYSLTFDIPYNWEVMIETYKLLDFDDIKLINYETSEVYSKYSSN